MKKIAFPSLFWSDEWGEPPKGPEQLERDKRRVQEILERMGYGDQFSPDKQYYEFELEVGSKALVALIEELQRDPHLGRRSINVWKKYTRQELESADLLVWRFTNQAIEDDWYDLEEDGYQGGPKASHKRCPACRAELEQVRDLVVDVRKMGKRDLSLTYGFEVILSARLARMLRESGLTGFTLRPVWDYRRPHQGDPPLFQLVVTNRLPPMASPPTEFEREQRCEVCGTESKYIKHTHWWGRVQYYEETNVYYPNEVLETVADFNRTAERFGDLPVSKPYILISQRAYKLLRGQNVKGWKVEPVYPVE